MITCTFEDGGKVSLRHATCGALLLNNYQSEILLIKRAANVSNCPNKWGLPGGFVDQGEYLTEAINREVKEETGYQCTIKQLFRITDNPNRPQEDRANIDFIFLGEALQQVAKHDHEISEVKWFPLNQVPSESEWAFDHYQNYQLLVKYLETPFALPIIGKVDL